MMRKSKDTLGMAVVAAYMVGAAVTFSALPFLVAAVIDFFFMLLMLGAFALLYRTEIREHLDSQYPKRGGRLL
jgi:hypothetical protein